MAIASNNNADADELGKAIFKLFLEAGFVFNNYISYPLIDFTSRFVNVIVPSVMADYAYYIDYFSEVLNCNRDQTKWDIFYTLIVNCGWIYPYEKTVLVCDRNFVDDTN